MIKFLVTYIGFQIYRMKVATSSDPIYSKLTVLYYCNSGMGSRLLGELDDNQPLNVSNVLFTKQKNGTRPAFIRVKSNRLGCTSYVMTLWLY